MSRLAERVQLLAGGFTVAVAVALALVAGPQATPTAAQEKNGKDDKAAKAADPVCGYLGKGPTKETAGDISTGIAGCRACHNGADKGEAGGYVEKYKSDEFVLLNESETWLQQDIHSRALKTLEGTLGQQIERILGRKDKTYRVKEDVRCLTCHSADKSPAKPLAEKKYADFATASGGVNCTVCHGLHQNWQLDHTKEPDQEKLPLPWRLKTPAYKWERGMADLRNPVVKAQLCVSCHVGNPAEGKIITHEMYAAGHPPLPPFELASYSEGEPKHWAYPTDKRLKFFDTVAEDERWPLFHFHASKDESYLSRQYAVGAIAALRAEASVLLAEAEAAAKSGDLIDYARFDCTSCHHELKYPSDRLNRVQEYDGPAGRPPLRASVGFPATVVAKHAEGIEVAELKEKAAGFGEKWKALKLAATAKPFGHPTQVKAAAAAVIDWCDGFLKVQCDFPKPIYTKEQAARLRAAIAETAKGPANADPEAAMSLAWAYTTLSKEAGTDFGEKLTKLGEVIPLNVRVEPYTSKDGGPATARFGTRMRAVGVFETKKFLEAFGPLVGK